MIVYRVANTTGGNPLLWASDAADVEGGTACVNDSKARSRHRPGTRPQSICLMGHQTDTRRRTRRTGHGLHHVSPPGHASQRHHRGILGLGDQLPGIQRSRRCRYPLINKALPASAKIALAICSFFNHYTNSRNLTELENHGEISPEASRPGHRKPNS